MTTGRGRWARVGGAPRPLKLILAARSGKTGAAVGGDALFTRLCAGLALAVGMTGPAGAATLAGVEFSVAVPDLFAMSPNPFTIGSSGGRTVAGNGGLPGDPSFTFDFSTSGQLDLTIGGDRNLVIGGAEAFIFNLTGEKRPTITGFDLISADILNFDRDDIGFTGGNLIIVIGGQDGNQPQWQPGHSATFQISTAVGAEIPLPGTLPLLAAALAALALARRRAAA